MKIFLLILFKCINNTKIEIADSFHMILDETNSKFKI